MKRNEKPQIRPICLCRSIYPTTILCSMMGLFPITTDHVNGQCVFRTSKPWLGYSVFRIFYLILQALYSTDLLNMFDLTNGKSIHTILTSVTDITYSVYITVFTIISVISYPKHLSTLNNLKPILQKQLLCQNALHVIYRVQYGYLLIICVVFSIQFITLTWLHYSTTFVSELDLNAFLNTLLQNVVFIFYALFLFYTNVFIGILSCYENYFKSCLNYVQVHPIKHMEQFSPKKDFLSVFYYNCCSELHPPTSSVKLLNGEEKVEFFRSLHEDICLVLYDLNSSLNPQLLIHTVVELTVLIINWYAVIIYTAYDFSSVPRSRTTHYLNCVYVGFHTAALFLLLKNFQYLNNMIHGLSYYLLEYSTRISESGEFLQVRMFLEKLKQFRPLTANGIFTVDLRIAGPICANILTYVLVALQFDVPKAGN